MNTAARAWHASLLTTKLFAPPPRGGRVLRPRLARQLDAAIQAGHKLILIAAPAGFGKTTVVSDWLMGDADLRRASWLTLDEADNDLAHFLTYLLAALEPLARPEADWAALSQRLADYPAAPPEAILTPILNDLAPAPGDESLRLLVLDDYHLIRPAAIHRALTFFIEHLPPRVHLVITTRVDPPLPLARWLARGEMSQLRADELSFNAQEATTFLNGTMGLALDPPQIDALESRTQGWIAGLQLAGIALSSANAGTAPRQDRARFITAFTGTHRVVLDYLIEEVLQCQSPPVQEFLLQTSILERMNETLCEVVLDASSEHPPARGMLDELERAHLFLTPLDDTHEWYRYHPLWLEALRHRFQVMHPVEAQLAHEKLSRWFEQHDFSAEAVHHAFAAKNIERAAQLIQKHATLMINRGEFAPLREWFARLPAQVYETRPRLSLARAWWSFLTGAREQASEWLLHAERAPDTAFAGAGDAALARGEIATLRSAILLEVGDWQGAMQHAAQARALIGNANVRTRGLAEMCSALAKFWGGQVVEVDRELEAAAQFATASGNMLIAFTAACHQGEVIMMQGRLRDAMQHFRALEARTREWGVDHRPFVALLHVNMGMVHFELNDLDACLAAFERAMELSDFGSAPREWLISVAFAAWVEYLQGNRQRAYALVARGEEHLTRYQVPAWASSHLIDTEQGLEIWDKDFEDTLRWLERSRLAVGDEPDYVNELAQITVARVEILHRQYDAALRLATRMRDAAERAERIGSLPRWYTLEALLYARRGDRARALASLARAIDLAQPRGFVRSIIDEGYTIEGLLQEMHDQPTPQDTPERLAFIRRLLRDAELDRTRASSADSDKPVGVPPAPLPPATPSRASFAEPPKPPASRGALPEPLSARELQVLQLVADGLSNREIAGQLVVGVGTVKTHINNIFRKLDAYSRTQALKRARELGLIQ